MRACFFEVEEHTRAEDAEEEGRAEGFEDGGGYVGGGFVPCDGEDCDEDCSAGMYMCE